MDLLEFAADEQIERLTKPLLPIGYRLDDKQKGRSLSLSAASGSV
jgi:hypothetical protein